MSTERIYRSVPENKMHLFVFFFTFKRLNQNKFPLKKFHQVSCCQDFGISLVSLEDSGLLMVQRAPLTTESPAMFNEFGGNT